MRGDPPRAGRYGRSYRVSTASVWLQGELGNPAPVDVALDDLPAGWAWPAGHSGLRSGLGRGASPLVMGYIIGDVVG